MRLDHLLSKENVEAGEIRASVVRRRVSEITVVQISGTVVSESRYRIPEGPPVPIPNTEVKLRRAEDTLPVTARENRSAPTLGHPLSTRIKKRGRMERKVERRFCSETKKEDKILSDFFDFIQTLFLPSISSSRSTKYAFGTRSRGLSSEAICQTATPERGCSSVGRAPALQAGGHGFESHHLHQSGHRRKINGLVAQLVRAPA